MTLRSIVLHLLALDAARVRATHGHQAHAVFMDLVRQADTGLAQRLHDQRGEKPFTVSPLLQAYRPHGHDIPLMVGEEYRLRFTVLSEELFSGLAGLLLRRGVDAPLTLGAASLAVRTIDSTPRGSPGAAAVEVVDLLAQAMPCPELRIEFMSPTAFSHGQRPWGRVMDLLPQPESVFDSLARRWNSLVAAPADLAPIDRRTLGIFLEDRVRVSRLEGLETRALHFGRGPQLGFTGTVTYTIQGLSSYHADSAILHQARMLDLLSNFAFYSGIGYKTTMGMGQARRLRLGSQ